MKKMIMAVMVMTIMLGCEGIDNHYSKSTVETIEDNNFKIECFPFKKVHIVDRVVYDCLMLWCNKKIESTGFAGHDIASGGPTVLECKSYTEVK